MDRIAVLDFGGQYTQLIARRVRELGVYTEILPSETPIGNLRGYKGLILSGGPASVEDADAPRFDPGIFSGEVPVLGICYGMQLMAYQAGGSVSKSGQGYGSEVINISDPNTIFSGMERDQAVWMNHGDSVTNLPPGYKVLATANDVVTAISNPEKSLYGVQFHPEVTHTLNGTSMLKNFVFPICDCSPGWTDQGMIERAQSYIRDTVGDKPVLVLVSGGVDSTVTVALLKETLGPEKVYALHIDNGLLRKNESRFVATALADFGVSNLRVVDYGSQFLNALGGVMDPERKRSIIGDLFMEVADKETEFLGLPPRTYLAQGTLYTDRIESGGGVGNKASRIKLHHNRTQLVRKKQAEGLIVEPNRDLYKDEVRRIGEALGLPPELVWRHPFPGPGLGVRVICLDTPYVPEDFTETAGMVSEVSGGHGFEGYVLPIRTVGVQGDHRTFENLAMLSGPMDWAGLRHASEEITHRTKKVNRVAYVSGGSVPDQSSLMRLSPLEITPSNLDLLREADSIANTNLGRYGLERTVQQMPVVLFPGRERSWVGIRDIVTDDFMTGRPARKPDEFPWEAVASISSEIMDDPTIRRLGGIEGVVFDVTDKPPGTIEWE